MKKEANIYLVDDDSSMRKGVMRLLKSLGMNARAFESAEEFLAAEIDVKGHSCLILDIRMPGLTGMELQEELLKRDYCLPIIFITGHGDIPMSVDAMKKGAVDFLKKPFDEKDLLDAIETALAKDVESRAEFDVSQDATALVDKLTEREKEILAHVIAGMLNKHIAVALDISEKTVKAHRGNLTEKLGVTSVADLVRLAEKGGISPAVG
jgi:FixJ family two-component response regulator